MVLRRAKSKKALSVHIYTPKPLEDLLKKGMKVIVAISNHEGDRPCPHCVTYQPIWKSISSTEGRNIPMVSMPSNVYSKTQLASQKPVNSVPTVLLVDSDGSVSEVEDIRNETKMKNLVTEGIHIPGLTTETETETESTEPIMTPVSSSNNPLRPLPGLPVTQTQVGGNPWAAFLMAAKEAAPAAMLLGAYSALPKRSSGLGKPKKTRRKNRMSRRR